MKIKYDGSSIDEPIDEIIVENDFTIRLEEGIIVVEYLDKYDNEYVLDINREQQLDKFIQALQLAKSLGWLHKPKVVVDNSDYDDSETSSEG